MLDGAFGCWRVQQLLLSPFALQTSQSAGQPRHPLEHHGCRFAQKLTRSKRSLPMTRTVEVAAWFASDRATLP